ncbi:MULTISPECIES: phage antirepressor KilAC domain-containing protein [unclassified Pseudomonas]|uniref:Phage antirepressor KilAC domain-containing protein n=1 Tax=Pseudomonas sp. MYb327 TaxID=2745230 RepID=A0AAU8DW91_9PSED
MSNIVNPSIHENAAQDLLNNSLKYLQALAGQTQALVEDNTRLAHKIEEDAPKVEFYDAVKSAVNCQTMEQVAKKYGVGTHTLFKLLRECKVLRDALDYPPYQQYIDSGHFKAEGRVYQVAGKGRQYNRTMVTGKGEIYIGTLLRRAGLLPENEAT